MFNLFKKGSDSSIGAAFQAAAKKGDPQAQYELGLAYAKAAQMTEASSWFQKAAKSGYAEAQYALGMCYRDGTGVDKKNVQAVKWFLLAANQGNADAAFQLGALIEGPSWGGWGKGEEPRDGEKAAGYSGDPLNKGSDSRQAAKWFCQAANAGQVEAQQKLGSLYWQKVDTDSSRNGVQKMEWYLKAVEAGDVVAEYKLFEMYYEGNGLPKDKKKALSWLRSAAEKNHAEAQYKLAWHYTGKEGDYSVVAEDSVAAATWFRKAADLGYKEAQYELALLLAHGEGVPQDLAEAEAWAQKARQQDPKYAEPITLLAEIQTLLGSKSQGKAGQTSQTEVMALLREAADLGDGEAQYRLGKLHEQREEYDQAAIWYAQAMQTSWRVDYDKPYSVRASFNLGLLYEKGLGVSQDLERSEQLIDDCISWIKYDERPDRKALFNEMLSLAGTKAEAGSKVVALNLAALYGRGWGKIDGNPVEEKKWKKLANTSGHAEIEENIPATTSHTSPQIQTEASAGTKPTSKKEEDVGYQVYGPAAEAGDAEAQYNLGAMYFGQNPEKAIAWLTKAAVQGYSHAFTLLGSIYGHGTGGVALDTQKATQWYRMGADGGDAQCQYTLGYMYAEGTWVPQDDAQANYWLEKAMASGKLAQEQYNAALAYNIDVCKRMESKKVDKKDESLQKLNQSPPNDTNQTKRVLGNVPKKPKKAQVKDNYLHTGTRPRYEKQLEEEEPKPTPKTNLRKLFDEFKKGSHAAKTELLLIYPPAYTTIILEIPKLEQEYIVRANAGESVAQYELYRLGGEALATYTYGGYREQEQTSIIRDPESATKWLQAAAENGHVEAQYKLGDLLMREGHTDAILWLDKAAKNGHAEAKHRSAFLKTSGTKGKLKGEELEEQIKRSDKDAEVHKLRRNAESGNRQAQYNLALLLAEGKDMPQNLDEAEVWAKKAFSRSDSTSYFQSIFNPQSLLMLRVAIQEAKDFQAKSGNAKQHIPINIDSLFREGRWNPYEQGSIEPVPEAHLKLAEYFERIRENDLAIKWRQSYNEIKNYDR